ncbi:MAG: outer membrane protein transport protein [Gemmatimonadetes bacterium]|nr:outer membrane protein transport protein [Gemmatimonadota bacterium]
MRRSLAIAGAAAVACAAAGTPLHAQGSSVDQQSACMAGRVGAGVAMPCDDGSAVYFSPAGLAHTPSVVSAGVALVRAGGSFRYDAGLEPADGTSQIERETANVPVPQAFINYRASDRLAVGIGALAPYGLGLEWPVCAAENPRCGEPNFEGRFTGYDNTLRGFYIQPTVAYQVVPNRLSVGAGVDYVMGSIEVHRRQFGPAALGLGNAEIADVTLEGNGTGFTYHLGAILRLDPRTSLGVRYLGSAEVDMDGDAAFVQVSTGNPGVDALIGAGLPRDQGVGTTVEFPAQLVVGVAYGATDRLSLLADFQRTYWSSFDALPVEFEIEDPDTLRLGYNSTNTFRFAADFQASDALAVRAGFRYNEAASPRATPFLPEGERNYYTLGLGYRLTRALSTDFSFQYINQPDRAGPVVPEGPRAGVYEATGMVFNFTLAYRFGGRGR